MEAFLEVGPTSTLVKMGSLGSGSFLVWEVGGMAWWGKTEKNTGRTKDISFLFPLLFEYSIYIFSCL